MLRFVTAMAELAPRKLEYRYTNDFPSKSRIRPGILPRMAAGSRRRTRVHLTFEIGGGANRPLSAYS